MSWWSSPEMFEITPTHAWTGSRYIDVARPRPEDLILSEIATGLSREQRFKAASTRVFWSVAQHSLLCDDLAVAEGVTDLYQRRAILFHDAAEYILGDCIRPVKGLCSGYREVEARFQLAVAVRFGVPLCGCSLVERYDSLAFSLEKEELIAGAVETWPGTVPTGDHCVRPKLLSLTMRQAARAFTERAIELGVRPDNGWSTP